ncbi:MAG: amino acid-binding protein [Firmicutes bacterium]|nr:amino acid-binding protein [Bacillota bacterium]
MIVRQISVFLENRQGTLAKALSVLHDNGVNLRAMTVADTADFGIMRIVVNEPEKVEKILQAADYAVKITPVLALKVEDAPGELMNKVQELADGGISVEYVYAFATADPDGARVVFKVDKLEQAYKILIGKNIVNSDDSNENYW